MLKVLPSEKYGTRIPGVGVSSSTSQASNKSYRDMLNSIREEPSGTSMSYKDRYQNALHSLMGFYQGPTRREIFIENVKEVVKVVILDTFRDLHDLLAWDEGWNGYDACAPKCDAVIHAMDWVNQFFLEVMD